MTRACVIGWPIAHSRSAPVPGFEKWFGVRPQLTGELRDLVVADLERL